MLDPRPRTPEELAELYRVLIRADPRRRRGATISSLMILVASVAGLTWYGKMIWPVFRLFLEN